MFVVLQSILVAMATRRVNIFNCYRVVYIPRQHRLRHQSTFIKNSQSDLENRHAYFCELPVTCCSNSPQAGGIGYDHLLVRKFILQPTPYTESNSSSVRALAINRPRVGISPNGLAPTPEASPELRLSASVEQVRAQRLKAEWTS